jgi:hypothetical protein
MPEVSRSAWSVAVAARRLIYRRRGELHRNRLARRELSDEEEAVRAVRDDALELRLARSPWARVVRRHRADVLPDGLDKLSPDE